MKRKIIQQGKQAFTITLPIEWIRQHGLDKNSEIDIAAEGKNLVISSGKTIQGEKIKLDFNGLVNREMYVHVIAAYVRGVDEIRIVSDKDISSNIYGILAVISGFGMVEQSKNLYVLRDINPGFYSSLEEIFKRVYQMILSLYDSSIRDIFGEQKETRESAFQKDMEINKFCFYLQRAVNKISYSDKIEERVIFTYSHMLEQIGDEIRRMMYVNIDNEIKKGKNVKELVLKSKEVLDKSFFLFFNYNKKTPGKIYVLRNEVREIFRKIQNSDIHTIDFCRHAVHISELVAHLNELAILKNL
ncbi:AbrB/MazE/SpoVT family DNA-binding domain-containing protein [Pseudomonadota bacterium]